MSDRQLRPEAIVERLREVIADSDLSVDRGVLFGSRVTDDRVPNDTDIILVSSEFEGVPGYRRPAPILERWDHARWGPIDVLCFTPAEFAERLEGAERTLVDRALEEGIVFAGEEGATRIDDRRADTPSIKGEL